MEARRAAPIKKAYVLPGRGLQSRSLWQRRQYRA